MFGEGAYSLSSVMEIEGTEEYVHIAENTGQCQNKESEEQCLSREYLFQGLEECSCTPYKLRNYSQQEKVNHESKELG